MGVKYEITGKGYVIEQNIKENEIVKDDQTVTIKLNK